MIAGWGLSLTVTGALVAFLSLNHAFLLRYGAQRRSGSAWAWDYTLFTLASGLLLGLQPALLPGLGWTTRHAWGLALQGAGLALVAGALGLHVWARLHLKKFYAERVEIQADHRVVDSGPYAFVRHPIILSFVCLAGGLLLLNPSLVTVLAFGYTCWDFGHAAHQEEDLLSRELPGYTDYMRRVPRLFPRFGRKGRS